MLLRHDEAGSESMTLQAAEWATPSSKRACLAPNTAATKPRS